MSRTHELKWSPQLATGLADVDGQHQQLIEIINVLGSLHARAASSAELSVVLAELHDYTVYHFQHEADLMDSLPVGAGNRNAHLKDHEGFVNILVRAGEMVATNPDDVVAHLLAFLVKWLVHHITGVDARMAREIIALRAGTSAQQLALSENPLHDSLINTVSSLYDSICMRTFEILELNRQLQIYSNKQEEENLLAQDIILRLMQRSSVSSPQVKYWHAPATTFSGDILAAVPGPAGKLYALVADATGHGLAAAITVLPVLSAFQAMAERGLPLCEMLVEINRNLRETLPSGRFVAATLICVDSLEHSAEVWLGGMPELLLLDGQGRLLERLSSAHLPLGIVNLDAAMSATTKLTIAVDHQFVLYSDGVVEATNSAGEAFGVERLCQVMQASGVAQRIAAVQAALQQHCGPTLAHDDISLMLVGGA